MRARRERRTAHAAALSIARIQARPPTPESDDAAVYLLASIITMTWPRPWWRFW
jgi:hypothetical protein